MRHESPEAQTRSTSPPVGGQRDLLIDVLRGAAILMILVSNIQEFALPRAGYFFPSVYDDFGWPGRIAWHLDSLFFNGKSLLLFAMIFGAGQVMAMEGAGHDRSFAAAAMRRLFVLLGIGLLHSYLIWDGDILVCLAICGAMAWPWRRCGPRGLLAGAAGFGLLAPLLVGLTNTVTGWWDISTLTSSNGNLVRYAGRFEQIISALRGDWLDQFAYRVPAALEMHTFVLPYHLVWIVTAAMLLGMAMYQSGVMRTGFSGDFHRRAVAAAVLVGLPATMLGPSRVIPDDLPVWLRFQGAASYEFVTGLIVALGWIGILALITRKWPLSFLVRSLAATGTVSLTFYLLQSLLCTLIFYGHGLGLFARMPRAALLLIVLAMWVLQVALALQLKRRHRRGPAEVLWRRLATPGAAGWQAPQSRVSAEAPEPHTTKGAGDEQYNLRRAGCAQEDDRGGDALPHDR